MPNLLTRRIAQRTACAVSASLLACGIDVANATSAPTSAPQVLLAITNSESMDGTTAGAIMVGSGSLGSSYSSLGSSSSPTSYTVPTGFTAPVSNTAAGSVANYTVACSSTSSYFCDNSPSRMNFTKSAILSMLSSSYGSALNFGIYTYSTGSPSLYTTWVYYMSPTSGTSSTPFTFTNTASSASTASTTLQVANPCYNYSSSSSLVKSSCTQIATAYGAGVLSGNAYMNTSNSSDDPQINDVLYVPGNIYADFLTYGTVSPANPYTYYSLSTYNTNLGGFSVSYSQQLPSIGSWQTSPTNAGYAPYSAQVLYSQRGFGYGASQSSTTGSVAVPMSTDPASSSFTNALAPETNNPSSSEIKSVAGQSGVYGLLNGAKSYLNGLSTTTCQGQYVVLLTDGLPTLDRSGNAWPPLGTTTATKYSLTATYNSDGSFSSSNSQAVTDAITAVTALKNAGIKVYVIGLGAGVDPTVNSTAAALLTAMAIAGGTNSYFAATNAAALTSAFATIATQIYNNSAVAAPVAPISVANGTSREYDLTSIASPASGYVKAYPVDATGLIGTTQAWDAAAVMNTSTRTAALIAPDSTGASMKLLSALDTAAFGLASTSTCVPNVTAIINFTINPSYAGISGCSYLAGRLSGWYLGAFSTQNTGHYVGPPTSTLLGLTYPTYAAYATAQKSRTPMLLFTNEDGFLYAVDGSTSSTGALLWGWTSRNVLKNLQYYGTFASSGWTNGGFTVADAMDSSGVWGSYLVGSFQSGSEHYSVKLDSTGKPNSMVYDTVVANGTSPGDKAGATGATPSRQPTLIAYIGNSAYAVYVVTVGTVSTLYETNVATGTSTSTALPVQVSSELTLNTSTNQLYFGGTDGSVRTTVLTSGTALTDIALLQTIGVTRTPVNGASAGTAITNVLYVGYATANNAAYIYALNSSQLTVFGVRASGWAPLWSTSPTQGFTYSTTWVTSSVVTKLTASSVISDIPVAIGSALLVPVYVAGATCSPGTGYYDFFDLATGAFPHFNLSLNGVILTGDISVGSGPAFSPSVTSTAGGVVLTTGSYATTTTSGNQALKLPQSTGNRPIGWHQRQY